MAKPFKFRYVNEITGAFVLLVVFFVIAGVIMAGRAQRWFEPVNRLTLRFPVEGSFGLKGGSEIQILGTTVGAVSDIVVEEDGRMSGTATIRGDFIRFVREDSKAIARMRFGVAGDTFVEITKGNGAPLPKTGAVLNCTKDAELMEILDELLSQIRVEVVPTVTQIRRAVETYTTLAESLLDPEDTVQKSLVEVNGILSDVRQVTRRLPAMAETIGSEVDDARGIVLQSQETIRETTRLLGAVERHWLIRNYVDQADPSERIPPARVTPVNGGRP